MSYKKIVTLTGLLLSSLLAASAAEKTYTITSASGQNLEIQQPFFDGEILKATRNADGMRFSISPETLTPESWAQLNRDATADMRVSLRVKPVSFSRRDNEHQTQFGTYESTKIARTFKVEVSSTSHFEKPTKIICFWISGMNIQTEKHQITLSRNQPYLFETGGTASQYTLKGLEFPGNYRESKETDFVVVAEHEDGTISEIYATQRGAEELIEHYYINKKNNNRR